MKVASRFLAPLEIFIGLFTLSWGLSAYLHIGALNQMLTQHGEHYVYSVVFIACGWYMAAIAAIEWVSGKQWTERVLYVFACMRSMMCFLTCLAWSYNFYLFATIGLHHVVAVLVYQTPIAIVGCVYAYIENAKVRYALDPRYPTPGLRFHR
jgi:hypothetical protein